MTYKQLSFLGAMVLAVMCTVPAGASPSTTSPQTQKNWKEKAQENAQWLKRRIQEPFQSQQQRDRNNGSPVLGKIDCEHCTQVSLLCGEKGTAVGESYLTPDEQKKETEWCQTRCGSAAYQSGKISQKRQDMIERVDSALKICESINKSKKNRQEESPQEVMSEISVVHIDVDSMGEIQKKLDGLEIDLGTTAVFFDFDETLVRTVRDQFKFLPSPDLQRTYWNIYRDALKGKGLSSEDPQWLNISYPSENHGYEFLEEQEAKTLVSHLKAKSLGIRIISAQDYNPKKGAMLEKLGLNTNDYFGFKDGTKSMMITIKLKTEFNRVQKPNPQFGITGGDKKLSAIVLIDNSYEYSLKPFAEGETRGGVKIDSIKDQIEKSKDRLNIDKNLKIIAIHYKKFENELKEGLIKEIDEYMNTEHYKNKNQGNK